jgi:hypothetical protein
VLAWHGEIIANVQGVAGVHDQVSFHRLRANADCARGAKPQGSAPAACRAFR